MTWADLSHLKQLGSQGFWLENPTGLFVGDLGQPCVVCQTGLSTVDLFEPDIFTQLLDALLFDQLVALLIVVDEANTTVCVSKDEEVNCDEFA